VKFWQRRREVKLYRQWTKHAGLPPQAIPQREIPKDMTVDSEERDIGYQLRVKIINLVKKVLRVE